MIGPEITVPDLFEEVVGYRTFRLKPVGHNYVLTSPHRTNVVWRSPEMRAECDIPVAVGSVIVPREPKKHSAPQKGCSCGIYSYLTPTPVQTSSSLGLGDWMRYMSPGHPFPGNEISALMVSSGTIEVHSTGLRAERARICALGINERLGSDEVVALGEIAKRWDIPVVRQEGLFRLAPEYGRSLDPSMLPKASGDKAQVRSATIGINGGGDQVDRIKFQTARARRYRHIAAFSFDVSVAAFTYLGLSLGGILS